MALTDALRSRMRDSRQQIELAEGELAAAAAEVAEAERQLQRARDHEVHARIVLDGARRARIREHAQTLRERARDLRQQAEQTDHLATEPVRIVTYPAGPHAKFAGERVDIEQRPIRDRLTFEAQQAELEASRLEHVAGGDWAPSETLENAVRSIDASV